VVVEASRIEVAPVAAAQRLFGWRTQCTVARSPSGRVQNPERYRVDSPEWQTVAITNLIFIARCAKHHCVTPVPLPVMRQ
jgi:hypothetical protein